MFGSAFIHSSIHPSIHPFILLSLFWQVHSLFQSQFSPQWNLVQTLSISSSTVQYLLTSPSSSSRHFYPSPWSFPSTACFRRQFLNKLWPIQLAFLIFTVYRTFLSSMTLCNTSSFVTFSVHHQHHIWKLSRYFLLILGCIYAVGSKNFRPGIQKPRQMENAVRDI